MSGLEHRLTILMVGQGEPMQTALGEALRRHGTSVAGCATVELEQAVRVYAPDLVVLIGDAAVRGGASVIRRMAASRITDVLPVAVVSNDAALKHERPEFRTGAVAIVPRGSGADSIARRLAELAEEVPQRPGFVTGRLNEHNLQDVVDLVSRDTKTGILSIRSPRGVLEGMPVIVETEQPSAHNMELILDRLREAMSRSEPLEYEFHEASAGRLSTLPGPIDTQEFDLGMLRGSRIVILDSHELRAEKLAQVLIQRGVRIAAADFSTAVIPRIREIDPQVVVLDSNAVGGQGIELVRAMRKDPQLRWASMLVVRWEDFWPADAKDSEPDVAQLASRIAPLVEQDLDIVRRVEDEVDFDTRLELIGPGRLLRALGSVPGVRHVAVSGLKRNVEIDLADNSVVGAYATLHDGTTHTLQGMPALLALWGLNSGRVSIREQDLPSVANIMMPVDEALGVVSHELAFIDGSHGSIEVNAETQPPTQPEVDEHATIPPGAKAPPLDEARTMAPPRFAHLQSVLGDSASASFSEEEAPTNKVSRMLGRVETRQQPIPALRGAEEHMAGNNHVDHAVARPKKSTQLGLAPAFEALPDELLDEVMTVPAPRKPPPPPPPALRPTPLFDDRDDEYDRELARRLEGTTMLAPSTSGGTPAWLQALLLVTLLVGVGVAGWLLWSNSESEEPLSEQSTPGTEEERAKGPITGSVNGLGEDSGEAVAEDETDAVQQPEEPSPDTAAEVADEVVGTAPPTAKTPAEPAEETRSGSNAAAEPKEAEHKTQPIGIPTQNLPPDPARASDVLVHRALPLIRRGELDRAEATLDRAWELDPRNPQAMAGYAALYIERRDGDRAVKWAKKAVKKRSRRAQYHVLYGDALRLQGDLNGARKAWRKALSIEPGNKAAKARLTQSADEAVK